MSAQEEFANYIISMPEAERASLLDSMETAVVLANLMQLNGAKVRGGDVQHALARLGLRLVSVDDGDPAIAAQARLAAVVETADCACGGTWVRQRDAAGPGAGWWHEEPDDPGGVWRRCEEGNRPPRK
jgi:hypothetical protein